MSRHFIIASHGRFAEGIYDSVRLILGEQQNVHTICGYVDERDIKQMIQKVLISVPDGEPVIALTDFFGGSINNEFMNYCGRKSFYLVAGMNLPLLLELFLAAGTDIKAEVESAVTHSGLNIIFCNSKAEEAAIEDEF